MEPPIGFVILVVHQIMIFFLLILLIFFLYFCLIVDYIYFFFFLDCVAFVLKLQMVLLHHLYCHLYYYHLYYYHHLYYYLLILVNHVLNPQLSMEQWCYFQFCSIFSISHTLPIFLYLDLPWILCQVQINGFVNRVNILQMYLQ